MERVDATERIVTFVGDPEPPEAPGAEEWRDMQVRLRTNGSTAVGDAYDDFANTIRSFSFEHVPRAREIKTKDVEPDEAVRVLEELEEARKAVRERLRTLERLVSEELATL
jgi:hypothetical protein